jgi:tetratricopeptide (TPR) repeat protein
LRLGEIHFNAGRLDEAERHYQATLKLVSRNAHALIGLGKIQAARGKDQEAIDLYMRAESISPELAMLADLGDLCTRIGKDFVAQLYYEKVEREGVKNPAFNRELSLFYSNHDRKLPEALDLARKDLAVRKDIYAYDTLAWALCKNQHYAEARDAISQALSLGTQDASLHYHAGIIYQRLKDTEKARAHLERALAINPHFSVAQGPEARRRLEELKK